MKKSNLIIIIIVLILLIGTLIYIRTLKTEELNFKTLANTSIGTVEVAVAGNESASTCIALITGIHPRETLSIEPVIQAAREYGNSDVKIIIYKVTVTQNPQDYKQGRDNGESLVHDFVNPSVTQTGADAVIISHSHIAGYGHGFYLATPEMDDASVNIAEKINYTSDFNYYPVTGNETYKSTSAVLVSKPIAQAGYPTFVYEIPEDIFEWEAKEKTKELFGLIIENI